MSLSREDRVTELHSRLTPEQQMMLQDRQPSELPEVLKQALGVFGLDGQVESPTSFNK